MGTKFILVVGMHRSGTSCLTGCLEEMGLNLGQVSTQNRFNAKGNKEDKRIFRLNESVLNYSGGAWNQIPKKLKWLNEHKNEQYEVLKYYKELSSPVGIKDPRMLITLPFWEPALPKASKFIGSFRDPDKVVRSLASRGKNLRVDVNAGYKLWYSYNKKLINLHKKHGFRLINFDWNSKTYLEAVRQAGMELMLPNYENKIKFFDSQLINQTTDTCHVKNNAPWKCQRLYSKLKKISER